MSEKEKKEIADMVATAKELARKDPQGFMLAKNSVDILKARADLEDKRQEEEEKQGTERQCNQDNL